MSASRHTCVNTHTHTHTLYTHNRTRAHAHLVSAHSGDGDGGDGAADVERPPTIFMAERAAAWGLLDGLIHFGFTTETKISTADSVPGIVLSTP